MIVVPYLDVVASSRRCLIGQPGERACAGSTAGRAAQVTIIDVVHVHPFAPNPPSSMMSIVLRLGLCGPGWVVRGDGISS